MASCQQDVIYEADYNVTLDKDNTYYVGEPVKFNFTGDVDNILFYSGETGHSYKFKDRYAVLVDDINTVSLKIDYEGQWGYTGGLDVYVTNTFEGLKGNDGEADRALIAEMIGLTDENAALDRNQMQEIVDDLKTQYADAVVFITGDFNDLRDTDVYNTACDDYGYQDSAIAAQESYSFAEGTWNMAFDASAQGDNYPDPEEGAAGDNLDYCFADDQITIQKFIVGDGKATITATDGSEKTIYTSDHRPIITDMCFETEVTGYAADSDSAVNEDDPNAPSVYSGTPDTSWYTGDQTEYVLTTADQLAGIPILRDESKGEITFEGVTIKLGRDMVLNEGTLEEIMLRDAGNYAWKRLNSAYLFKGTFDGQGHTIYGLYMTLANHGVAGMFGGVGGNAVIKDFTLENACIRGTTEDKDTMGTLVSRVSGDGSNVTISGVTVNAALVENNGSMDYVGGLIGRVDEMLHITLTVEDCTFNGKIQFSEGDGIGGIIGRVYNRNANIILKNCAVNANLTAEDYCGGMIGYVGDNAIVNTEGCTYNGTMTSGGNKGDIIGNP